MGRKKKVEDERTCANCRFGPEGQSDDCDECEDLDAWAPKEPDHRAHGERLSKGLDAIEKRHSELPDDCKISVNGGPEVPFPSQEATEQVEEVVKNHLDAYGRVVNERTFGNDHILIEFADGTVSLDGNPPVSKDVMKTIMEGVKDLGTETAKKVVGAVKQLNLEGRPAEFPVSVEAEEFTTLAFECGSWSLKVREDRLQSAYENDKVTALVQRRLKASNEMYPLKQGEFDRWVDRFARSLEKYVRTGCA